MANYSIIKGVVEHKKLIV